LVRFAELDHGYMGFILLFSSLSLSLSLSLCTPLSPFGSVPKMSIILKRRRRKRIKKEKGKNKPTISAPC
jgi:hypothetical protein